MYIYHLHSILVIIADVRTYTICGEILLTTEIWDSHKARHLDCWLSRDEFSERAGVV